MKILLVSTSIAGGGAANACLRLYQALRGVGVDVRILTLSSDGNDERIVSVASSRSKVLQKQAFFVAERLQILHQMRWSRQYLWRFSTANYGFDISKHPWVSWADVIHLHWINHGFLTLKGLEALAHLGKPIVWTLHDLWAATGGCHLPFVFVDQERALCPRYAEGCGCCPLLGSKQMRDLSWQGVRDKQFLQREAFHYIAVSRAEADLAKEGALLARAKPIAVIPPPIDLSVYAEQSCQSLPQWYDPTRVYLLMAAARVDDPVKGLGLLRRVSHALVRLSPEQSKRCVLLLVGQIREPKVLDGFGIAVQHLGSVRSPREMAQLYRLASLTLSTSLFETFGQTLTEALASGCPVISFRSAGPEDIVRHGQNGYLVDRYDTEAYAQYLLRALTEFATTEDDRLRARAVCFASVEHLSYPQIAQRQKAYYEVILGV